jgi:hypothetical protein
MSIEIPEQNNLENNKEKLVALKEQAAGLLQKVRCGHEKIEEKSEDMDKIMSDMPHGNSNEIKESRAENMEKYRVMSEEMNLLRKEVNEASDLWMQKHKEVLDLEDIVFSQSR